MMEIINFAHSALFMLGAYAGYVTYKVSGSFWLGLIIALVGLIAFGGFAKGKWY